MANKSTIIYDRLYHRIESSLKQPKNIAALKQVFGEIISRNNEALSSIIPDKAIYMDAKIEKKYFDILGIDPKEVFQALNDSTYIDNNWSTVKNPMYVTLILLVLYFNNTKKQDMVQQSMFICSLYMYRNIRTKYFKRTSEATINIVKYTISRLSYKNDLKKYGSVMKLIGKKSEMFVNNWLVERKSDITGVVSDEVICKMINDNHRRYSTAMNNFYAEFKKDSVSGNYLNTDVDIDDGDTFIESDNVSFMVEKNTQKVMNKFILSSYPNPLIIQHTCAIETGCSANNLRNMMNYVYDGNDKLIDEITRIILQIYLFEYKKKIDDIKSSDFLITMRAHYKKQTTNDQNLNDMKTVIDKIVVGSGLSKKINRAATLNDCKKGLYLYILFLIQRSLL